MVIFLFILSNYNIYTAVININTFVSIPCEDWYNVSVMKILVGLSGGVDSAIAAYLLKEQGHEVTCAFMRNWDSLTNSDIEGNPTLNEDMCTQEKDYQDALSVANKLDLPLLRIDFIEEYWEEVFETFLREYRKGRTPNPDILCNKYIKFDHFYDFAKDNGFSYLATGHYAKRKTYKEYPVIAKASDLNKDQSYFLAQVNPNILSHVLFPLEDIDKTQVRQIAEELDLSIAKKKDSTVICFIGERKFREFLSNYLPMKEGNILNIANHKVIGRHQGVMYYTVGQRKGLNIGGTGPYYVIGKNVEKNELYVTEEAHKEWLISDFAIITNVNQFVPLETPLKAHAKFRYRQSDQDVIIEKIEDDTFTISYTQGIAGVTPGQQAVFYLDDVMVAGGTIDTVYQDGVDLMKKINQEME